MTDKAYADDQTLQGLSKHILYNEQLKEIIDRFLATAILQSSSELGANNGRVTQSIA